MLIIITFFFLHLKSSSSVRDQKKKRFSDRKKPAVQQQINDKLRKVAKKYGQKAKTFVTLNPLQPLIIRFI